MSSRRCSPLNDAAGTRSRGLTDAQVCYRRREEDSKKKKAHDRSSTKCFNRRRKWKERWIVNSKKKAHEGFSTAAAWCVLVSRVKKALGPNKGCQFSAGQKAVCLQFPGKSLVSRAEPQGQ